MGPQRVRHDRAPNYWVELNVGIKAERSLSNVECVCVCVCVK